MLDVVGIWNCMCLKAQIAEKLKHKITVESRNKICILNFTFLRIGEGEEAGFLLNTDSYFKYMLQITVCQWGSLFQSGDVCTGLFA